MKRRCDAKHRPHYKAYGGRGIAYDPRWKDYRAFWEDMWSTYESDLTLDRIDNNGNYCKENCRWVSVSENSGKRRANRVFTLKHEGTIKTLRYSEWAKLYGIHPLTVKDRLRRGWPIEKCLTQPIHPQFKDSPTLRSTDGGGNKEYRSAVRNCY